MLTEIINFTKTLSDDFMSLGIQPKEGLHILMKINDNGDVITKAESIEYDFYAKKMKKEYSPLLYRCTQMQENAWCINTNKCYDSHAKAIHTCSPFSIAFKREHLEGGTKFKKNSEDEKPQLQERFKDPYFTRAKEIIEETNTRLLKVFESFSDLFVSGGWEIILKDIEQQRSAKLELLIHKEATLKEEISKEKDKFKKAKLRNKILDIQTDLLKYAPLAESDYILFYLDLPLSDYKEVHEKYLDEALLGTDKKELITSKNNSYGINKIFLNTINTKKPFLLHKTSYFEFPNRISNSDIRRLYEIQKVFMQKHLPNPLPIFIYRDEMFEKDYFSLCKEDGQKLTFRKTVESLYQKYPKVFYNYYLLNWVPQKNGIEVNDFDFVSKFEYELKDSHGDHLEIQNLFHIQNKKGAKEGGEKKYPLIKNIFELEDRVLKPLIQGKKKQVNYFSELKKEGDDNRDLTFLSYIKYRKSVYDYVYKSNRNAITGDIFKEMIFNAILDDLKNDNEYGIKEKLNYWHSSLYEHFYKINDNKTLTMASKLKDYEQFVADIINESANIEEATDKHFAFAAGQVIYYLLTKSKAENNGLKLIEPYLQKTSCEALKENITDDYKRYSHENFTLKFRRVASFVLSYETTQNMKKLQAQLLSGLFAKNQLFQD